MERIARDAIFAYLHGIGRYPLLKTAEAEKDLAQQIEAGLMAEKVLEKMSETGLSTFAIAGELATREELRMVHEEGIRAKQTFIKANLRLVVSIARQYADTSTLPLLDLIQEGNLGLIRAVEKFDYTKGNKFSTFAMLCIKQFIGRGIDISVPALGIPINSASGMRTLGFHERKLEQDLFRRPTDQELAKLLDSEPVAVAALREMRDMITVRSLNEPTDGTSEFGDLISDEDTASPEDHFMHAAMTGQLDKTILPQLSRLTEQELAVLAVRFGSTTTYYKPISYKDIAGQLGMSQSLVVRLMRSAFKTLRDDDNVIACSS